MELTHRGNYVVGLQAVAAVEVGQHDYAVGADDEGENYT